MSNRYHSLFLAPPSIHISVLNHASCPHTPTAQLLLLNKPANICEHAFPNASSWTKLWWIEVWLQLESINAWYKPHCTLTGIRYVPARLGVAYGMSGIRNIAINFHHVALVLEMPRLPATRAHQPRPYLYTCDLGVTNPQVRRAKHKGWGRGWEKGGPRLP